MKISFKEILFFCLILCSGINITSAQNIPLPVPPPPLHFTINAGYGFPNIAGTAIAAQGSGSNSGSFNPLYLEIGYNYSTKGVASLFISDANGATGNFAWIDTANNLYSYYYTVSIVTFGLSTQYHFGNSKHFSPYIGGMLGYRFINLYGNGDFPYIGATDITLGAISYQAYLGATYYFTKWLGLDAHGGYGNNYYGSVGLSFRFAVNRDE